MPIRGSLQAFEDKWVASTLDCCPPNYGACGYLQEILLPPRDTFVNSLKVKYRAKLLLILAANEHLLQMKSSQSLRFRVAQELYSHFFSSPCPKWEKSGLILDLKWSNRWMKKACNVADGDQVTSWYP